MKRYWKLDDDGGFELDGNRFLHTGDCGFINADNYLYLRDRADDVIISGGENVFPHEIEDVLILHPDVDQAAVIGVPDAKWGEAIKAVVVPREGADVSADQLIGHCRQHVAGFKTPRSVDFVADLPHNAAGKILRYQLRESYRRKTNSPTELTEQGAESARLACCSSQAESRIHPVLGYSGRPCGWRPPQRDFTGTRIGEQ